MPTRTGRRSAGARVGASAARHASAVIEADRPSCGPPPGRAVDPDREVAGMTMTAAGWWRVRVMTPGPTRDARYFGTRVLRRITELLPGTPVGFASDGLQLVH